MAPPRICVWRWGKPNWRRSSSWPACGWPVYCMPEAEPSFRGAYAETRGDILLAQGNLEAARDAYGNALTGYSDAPEKRNLVQMKLDDLAESKSE